ncbi:dioxygenase [Kineosporia sp. R_H_3]|uniref:dioxygenase family protein n=1 Tax=Kineosporia sp. R_H_3 TaxID=1961848 RepID=UPI000B4B6537|nr:class III extradiol ring-cleavage dioxygenase [Kineosporia sp. R_H_3]
MSSSFTSRPAAPAEYEEFLRTALPATRAQRAWTPADGPLPAMYYGHGAPPLLEDARWMSQLFAWTQSMPKPKDVLVISAHWESAPLSLSGTAQGTPLVYDFGGFPQMYYEMTYASPDSSALAKRVASAMPDTEPVYEHKRRGLDHGAWVPLKVMYPDADVPVVQMSLPTHDPARLLEIGRRIHDLRAEGTLVIGSGFLTHGLPFLTREHWTNRDAAPPAWSSEFDAWAGEALSKGDVDTLASFASAAPGMPYAHPTVEHFTPLFVTLGAAQTPDAPVEPTVDGFWMGLSKRSFQVT